MDTQSKTAFRTQDCDSEENPYAKFTFIGIANP